MGWLWTSTSSTAEPQQPTASLPAPALSTPSQTTPPHSSHQEDASFHEAFPHLAPSASLSTTTPAPTTASASTDVDPSLPTTMSCRAAFDSAFYCASFGGHFNDIYRYGHLRSCSEHWADWRFCMSLKGASAEGRANAIRERYKEKDEKLREGPNSEHVWGRRGPGEMIERPFGRGEEV